MHGRRAGDGKTRRANRLSKSPRAKSEEKVPPPSLDHEIWKFLKQLLKLHLISAQAGVLKRALNMSSPTEFVDVPMPNFNSSLPPVAGVVPIPGELHPLPLPPPTPQRTVVEFLPMSRGAW